MFLYLFGLVIFLAATAQGAIDADLVTNLPGLTIQTKFKQYSGYLKGAVKNRQLHYWLIESANNPAKDPLVLWLNGGPGCSSLDGLLSEHGPFFANTDGQTLTVNPYSWNRVANMLYLEAPACVGYSYSVDGNCTTSDDQVSLDNYSALKYFFNHYPEYADHEFFVTGESYGGIYVPTLSSRIVDDPQINFKGFAIGNGLTNYTKNTDSLIYFGYYHGLWGADLWEKLVHHCCDAGASSRCQFANNQDPNCQNAVNTANAIVDTLNTYNLYAECFKGSASNKSQSLNNPTDWIFNARKYINTPRIRLLMASSQHHITSVPPCIDARGCTNYLNRMDVRKALHIPDNLKAWEICSMEVGLLYIRQYTSTRPQFMKILNSGKYRVLVYNGDVDMACNFLGDQWFVDSLQQNVLTEWKAWHYIAEDSSQQVAGFVKEFENITFLTVKGAGHMVPQNKPIPALLMFTKYLKGEKY